MFLVCYKYFHNFCTIVNRNEYFSDKVQNLQFHLNHFLTLSVKTKNSIKTDDCFIHGVFKKHITYRRVNMRRYLSYNQSRTHAFTVLLEDRKRQVWPSQFRWYRSFHSWGPAAVKLLSPNRLSVRGVDNIHAVHSVKLVVHMPNTFTESRPLFFTNYS